MSVQSAATAQNRASFPFGSAWVGANAGSGKTRVLTDRVARLLLHGADPQSILCLTYTKAAAAEMKNRLFARLGEWSMLDDEALSDALHALGEDQQVHVEGLANARRLFAAALETPGELKIQTIHAFCAAVLRRFPLEARVSPQFREMDSRQEAELRETVLSALATQAEGSFTALAAHLPGDGPEALLAAIRSERAAFRRRYDRDALIAAFESGGGNGGPLIGPEEVTLLERLADALQAVGSPAEQKTALPKVRAILCASTPERADRLAESVLLFEKKTDKRDYLTKRDKFANKGTMASLDARDIAAINDLCDAVEAARAERIARLTLARTDALHAFAQDYIAAYEGEKDARGLLDFDDLIEKVLKLVDEDQGGAAAWVLYKLDGGIEHVLVDEAQDTSPLQWQVIRALTGDFFAGESTRDRPRTIFVVGDEKQSIYSFQGAEPRAFGEMRAAYGSQIAQSGAKLAEVEMAYSFRSATPVLALTDKVFDVAGRGAVSGPVTHLPTDPDKPGRVDLWTWREKQEAEEAPPWWTPLDAPSDERADLALARDIAAEIARMIRERDPLPRGDHVRPVQADDILILVQRRSVLFHALIRELKAAGVAVSGADRMKLGEELAVRDLMALMQWVTTPEDDLALAGVLRSPLFGMDEDTLFRIAHGRKGALLIQQLQEVPALKPIDDVLQDLRGQSDFLRPFEFLSRVLVRHDGRRKILKRLGQEAIDGVDELLAQAIAYEATEPPTLTGFLEWFASDETEVKRELSDGQGEVRVMTVHGAKGLEAPIVFLPDTAKRQGNQAEPLSNVADTPVWAGSERPDAVNAARELAAEKRKRESERLLYVALTRAEHHLIIAGAGDARLRKGGWYEMVETAFAEMEHQVRPFGLSLSHHWPDDGPAGQLEQVDQADVAPSLMHPPVPPAQSRALLSPSALGGAHALPGEGDSSELAMARGTAIHSLLETLPTLPRSRWDEMGATLATDMPELLAEAIAVLDAHPDVFGPDTLAEIAVAGEIAGHRVSGRIDRIAPRADGSVLIVDFKSNRVVPDSPETVPEAVLRQLGAYHAALAPRFAPAKLEVAVLWTATATLMKVPHALVNAALGRASLDPSGAAP
ncbi:double-strand break repair helicase AddA [Pontivivens insulae]|uniref:DNA 3'-5' helicase n=1 Tax=Pontivivens insulae TaxID=1639689 RepID=A0A2R8AFJ8_9RHOB|nr:double-strand break repair helicase AddA [Pontivivens insulae]RED12094.1 DNA helicase/exodeoxyribonuclease V subunit A [Pontivivens insulae]SPF30850.1 ATP-dependent helicase/nuclease subunit A [Pontivivens insulae]